MKKNKYNLVTVAGNELTIQCDDITLQEKFVLFLSVKEKKEKNEQEEEVVSKISTMELAIPVDQVSLIQKI